MSKFYMVWISANKKSVPKLYSIKDTKKEAKKDKKECKKSGYSVIIEKVSFKHA